MNNEISVIELLDLIDNTILTLERELSNLSLESFLNDNGFAEQYDIHLNVIFGSLKSILYHDQNILKSNKEREFFKTIFGLSQYLSHGYSAVDKTRLYNVLTEDLGEIKDVVLEFKKRFSE